MSHGVGTNGVPFCDHPLHDLWVLLGPLTDHEERRQDVGVAQHIENLWGELGVRPIVV